MVLYEELAQEMMRGDYLGEVLHTSAHQGLVVANELIAWLAERGVEYASYIIG